MLCVRPRAVVALHRSVLGKESLARCSSCGTRHCARECLEVRNRQKEMAKTQPQLENYPWGKHPGDTKSLNLQSTAPRAVLLPCTHCQELHLLWVDLS